LQTREPLSWPFHGFGWLSRRHGKITKHMESLLFSTTEQFNGKQGQGKR